jgi:hypothetical protein
VLFCLVFFDCQQAKRQNFLFTMFASSARKDWLVMSATAVLFFLCSPMLRVTGSFTSSSSISIRNPSLVRLYTGGTTRQAPGQRRTINTARSVSTTTLKAKDGDNKAKDSPDIDSIKAQLTEYLAKRKEIGADELAKK